MYKDKMFTSATDFKRVGNIRVEARCTQLSVLFAVIVSIVAVKLAFLL